MKVPEPKKLPSGTWFIQMRLNGVSVPVSAPSKKECIQQAQLIKAEYLAGRRRIASNDITLREAITEYIDAKKVYPRPPCRAMKKAAINTSSVLWINRFAIST